MTRRARRRRERDEWRDPKATLGLLPVPRRDVERLRQVLGTAAAARGHAEQPAGEARADRSAVRFAEALTWLEIHGQAPEIVEHWRGFLEAVGPVDGVPASEPLDLAPRRRRRRGRRRRYTDRPQ